MKSFPGMMWCVYVIVIHFYSKSVINDHVDIFLNQFNFI